VITANAAVGRSWAGHATGILAGVSAGITFLFGALDLAASISAPAGSGGHNPLAVDVGFMATAVIAATLASKPVRERAARVLPIDPDSPVHALALVLAVLLLGTQLSSIFFASALVADQALSPLTLGDLITQEVPFLILAAAGVGLYIRRNATGSAERLGLAVPRWWHVALALAAAGAFFAFSQLVDWLAHVLTPDIAHQVDRTTQHLFGGLGTPAGIAALALAPGICEEVLFRGALQPRLGLLLTALLFASIHTQYGISLDALAIFVIAVGLGLIRKYTNTTASCISHVTYNLIVGIGIGGAWLGIAIAAELALVALCGYALWSNRRREAVPANP
jgi:membrane protease YdiL (CAAX protease family)